MCPKIPVDLFHPPIDVSYTYKSFTNLKFKVYVFNWKSIIKYLGSIDWLSLFNSDINYNINTFYSHINQKINNCVPINCSHKLNNPLWFSYELKLLIRQKKNTHYIFKTLNTTESYLKFSSLRNKYKYIRYRDYKPYINNVQCSVKVNHKSFWKFDKNQKSISNLPATMPSS